MVASIGKNRKNVVSIASLGRLPVGGIEAGQWGRRLRAIPTSQIAINSAIRSYGRNALARSRYLCINNPLVANAKEEFVAALIGDGIKPSFKVPDLNVKTELQEKWLAWTDESDADGLTDFYGQQSIIGGEMYEAGEVFIRKRPRRLSDGFTVPMQLQILPSEMCPTDLNNVLPNGRRIEMGVQFDPIGRREGYWFYRNHPGELQFNFNQNPGEFLYFVPADQILHLFKPIRAGQIRGVPHTLSGIVTSALLDLYDDAELERKRTAALFSAFIVREANEEDGEHPLTGTPTETKDTSTGQQNYGMEPGASVELAPGQDVKFATPADVGANYDAFEYRNLLRAAAGLGVPYMQLTGDLRAANYGSQRGGQITFRRRICALQNHVIIFQFCRPIVQAFLEAGVVGASFETFSASEYAAAPRQYGGNVRWITPKWDWIDPLKDLTAEKLAVDSGFKPRSDVIEAMGYDAIETDELIAQDQERAAELGLKFVTLKTEVAVSPTSDDGAITSADPQPAPGDPAAPANSGDSLPPKPKKGAKKSSTRRKTGPFGTRFIWDR